MPVARSLPLALALVFALGAGTCSAPNLRVLAPAGLGLAGDVPVEIQLPIGDDGSQLEISIDDVPVPVPPLVVANGKATFTLTGIAAGPHRIDAELPGRASTGRDFELIDLDRPDECDVLNNIECTLPFPSSRFLEPAATPNGVRTNFGPGTLPLIQSDPAGPQSLSHVPFLQNDGYSPGAQILVHFPQGVDPVASNASRIDPATRVFGTRGLDRDSPTLLVEWESGNQINHWIEQDVRGADDTRRVTFVRPGESLKPGKRYIVAARRLTDPSGGEVLPEAVFRNIRDNGTSTIPGVEARRAQIAPVIERLRQLGYDHRDLIIAFDFLVQSDHSLTHEMLSMRDQSLAWLDQQVQAGTQTFTANVQELNPGCADPNETVWRYITGTFQVPLFLGGDPFVENDQLAFLQRDASGTPTWTTLTNAPYGIAIPCTVFDDPSGFVSKPPLLIGHGLFGEGAGTTLAVARGFGPAGFDFVAGGTNWAGLSTPDTQPFILNSFVVKVIVNLDQFEALPDRLRQGQTNALVLGRMLKDGVFNMDPGFQDASGNGVLGGDGMLRYWGASLGGIMGTMHAALSPDAERLLVDVPAINFSLLLQRATPFVQFQALLSIVNPDPLAQALGLSLNQELWVRGEPMGYATHITSNRLPGVGPKQVLAQAALHDQQVSNLGSLLLARTLRLGYFEGSALPDHAHLEERLAPQSDAFLVYDTAAFELNDPDHAPFIPPLENLPATGNQCDPHGRQAPIPAAIDQAVTFFETGQILNFCTDDGLCNASDVNEQPIGAVSPCDPLS